ncbi:TetR/AcrR family transcriptional regulator [Nocardia aurantia]|uniref:HTH tetR-type domain-containing protein n=1 Tax=Nocardia aurantia TaxID=2585199 RepID=A0A7K0DSL5_9NOCA|nr:TetR/AcrR family transcriptional regulator [Nocardia aurantia]MQY28362.1 hypothetical protein [Nocardia aurantia]
MIADSGRPERSARRRILDVARGLFYREGIRAVGVDRIIAEAGVAKATFYHHFSSKDQLVCAYLDEVAQLERTAVAGFTELPPLRRLQAVFDRIAEIGCGPDFHGCMYINAAAEYPDAGHPVRAVIDDQRRWFRELLRELLIELNHPDPDAAVGMLVFVRDGIMVGSNLDDTASVRARTRDAVGRLLADSMR